MKRVMIGIGIGVAVVAMLGVRRVVPAAGKLCDRCPPRTRDCPPADHPDDDPSAGCLEDRETGLAAAAVVGSAPRGGACTAKPVGRRGASERDHG